MIRDLLKVGAFLERDFLTWISYRLALVLELGGILLGLLAFYFVSRMIDPAAAGLNGIPPFDYLLTGVAFLGYFSTTLYAFSAKVRNDQVLGTLEAMLASPTSTSIVIFASAAWDYIYGAIRVGLYLLLATLAFGVNLRLISPLALLCGLLLTLLSSAGLGLLSASFVLAFKRGDPLNFLLSSATTFLGTVFFPPEQLPEWIRGLADWVPLTWSLRVLRGSLLQGRTLYELRRELLVLLILTVVVVPLGLLGARLSIRKAKRDGTLVQY
jgi:ABC-2 type transport system permease protein